MNLLLCHVTKNIKYLKWLIFYLNLQFYQITIGAISPLCMQLSTYPVHYSILVQQGDNICILASRKVTCMNYCQNFCNLNNFSDCFILLHCSFTISLRMPVSINAWNKSDKNLLKQTMHILTLVILITLRLIVFVGLVLYIKFYLRCYLFSSLFATNSSFVPSHSSSCLPT